MSGESEPDQSSFPTCPSCGQPIASVAIVGPTDGVAGPCGCRVAPATTDLRLE